MADNKVKLAASAKESAATDSLTESSGKHAAAAQRSAQTIGASSASDIVEIVVVTRDEFFLGTLRTSLGPATRLWHVPSAEKTADLLIAGSVGIMVLDLTGLGTGSAQFIGQMRRQFPELVLLAAGLREDEAAIAPLVSGGHVYRFMHLPLSEARARSFVQAAVKKYTEVGAARSLRPPSRIKIKEAASQRAPRREQLKWAVAASAAAVALIGAFFLRHAHAPTPVAPSMPPQDALLERAAQALAANRLTEPRGDNALQLYLAAVAAEPAEERARAGLAEVRERLLARAENALIEERLDDAQAAIETARMAGVEKGRIAFLTVQLSKAREFSKTTPQRTRAFADTAAAAIKSMSQSAPGTQSNQAISAAHAALALERSGLQAENRDRLLSLANDRLQQDRLIAPVNDSAKFYLDLALKSDPDSSAADGVRRDLSARLTANARRALDSGQIDAARAWLEEAAATGTTTSDWTRVKADIDAHPRSGGAKTAEPRSVPAPRTSAASAPTASALTASASAASASAASALENPALADTAALPSSNRSQATELGRITPPRPISTPKPPYPQLAAQLRTQGWVDLQFVVKVDGRLKDIVVLQSSPVGVFDAAARMAARQWKFDPARRNGVAVEDTAHLRVRFNLSQ